MSVTLEIVFVRLLGGAQDLSSAVYLSVLLPLHRGREIAAALAGNLVDTANIIDSRTRRKKNVDYVKLNETVFG